MGWTNKSSWYNTNEAIKDEARPNEFWDIVWHSGANYIYVDKQTGRPAHTHFLTRRDKDGIWIKSVGDFHSVTAAKKWLEYYKAYRERGGEEDRYLTGKVAEAKRMLKYDRVKEFKTGDTLYINEWYVYSGKVTFRSWYRGKKRSFLIDHPSAPCLLKCTAKMVDLDKTFPD